MFESEATIIWNIPATQPSGTYRISYFLDHKELGGTIVAANGTSRPFTVNGKGYKDSLEAVVKTLIQPDLDTKLQPLTDKQKQLKMAKYLQKMNRANRVNENDVLKGKGRNNLFDSLWNKQQG